MTVKTIRLFFIIPVLVMTFFACVPATEEVITDIDIKLDGQSFQELYNHIDRQEVDSILKYTSHKDPAYRYMVANAMASIQSIDALDSLSKLLEDPILEVRATSAYALGQLGKPQATTPLLEAFKRKDTLNVDNALNGNVLESIGKVGDEGLLKSLATVSTYRKTDTLLLLNQARAIYRFGLRGMTINEGTDHMVRLLVEDGYPKEVRELAAAYLQRNRELDLSNFTSRLRQVFVESENPFVKMRLATTLGIIGDIDVFPLVEEALLDEEVDYRVKVEILRNLDKFPYIKVIDIIIRELKSENLHVAHTAAQYLIDHGNPSDAAIYKDFISDDLRYSVKARIYEAILRNIPTYYTNTKANLRKEIEEYYSASNSPYEKAAYLKAIGQDPYNYELVSQLGLESKDPIIKTTSVELLGSILEHPNFIRAFKSGARFHTKKIVGLIQKAVQSGDAGMLATAGTILAKESLALSPYMVDSIEIYKTALSKLKLPYEIESYNALGEAISIAQGSQFKKATAAYNHPIKWSLFNSFGDSTIAVIKTNKGNITIKMFASKAPGTVSNFISLAQQNYFDDNRIHRVVPNFVIQGGCSRGDGYGGLDYTIRSELTQNYYDDEGYIGMASAGKDTEGTQWFITHSPTPHLDGKYSIFGKVIKGMDVVHNIQVGDITHDVIISRM